MIKGRYRAPKGEGRIDGTLAAGRLQVSWYQAETFAAPDDAGDGYFDVSADCSAMSGAFRRGFEGEMNQPWSAKRVNVDSQQSPEQLAGLAAAQAKAEQGFAALRAYRDQLPAAGFDVAALAATLGPTVDDAFSFVRDEIGYEPYAGVLRGARGVLLARAGNAFDRSLLLAAILRQHGFEVRFAQGTLAEDKADKLVADWLAAQPDAIADQPAPEVPQSLIEELGLDPAAAAARHEKAVAARTSFTQSLADDRQFQENLLATVLAGRSPGAGQAVGDARKALVAIARRHAWVQYQKDGQWIDLDPSFPDMLPGATLTQAQQQFGALPEDLWHRVQFVVSIERREADKLVTEELGGWEMRSASVMEAGVPAVAIVNYPVDPSTNPGLSWRVEDTPAAIAELGKERILNSSTFRPMLVLSNGETNLGKAFDLSGRIVSDDPQARLAGAVGGGFAGAAGALDAIFGGSAPAEQSTITAYWIDYRIVGPDQQTRSYRRALFDRIGAAARAAGGIELMGSAPDDRSVRLRLGALTQALVTAAPVTPAYASYLEVSHGIANERFLKGLLELQFGGVANATLLEKRRWYPGDLLVLKMLQEEVATEIAALSRVRRWQTAPNVIVLQRALTDSSDAGIEQSFDLVDVDMQALPFDQASTGALFQRQYGVAISATEAQLLAEMARRQCPDCIARPVISTVTAMRAATDSGVGLTLLQPGDADALASVDAPADTRSEIERDLAAGNWIVVPQRPVEVDGRMVVGWWRIDPSTGATLGMMNGQGGAFSEFVDLVGTTVFLFWPGMLGFGLGTAQCTGVSSVPGPGKALGCALCGLITGICFELAYLVKIDIGITASCGFWSAAAGLTACSATFL